MASLSFDGHVRRNEGMCGVWFLAAVVESWGWPEPWVAERLRMWGFRALRPEMVGYNTFTIFPSILENKKIYFLPLPVSMHNPIEENYSMHSSGDRAWGGSVQHYYLVCVQASYS